MFWPRKGKVSNNTPNVVRSGDTSGTEVERGYTSGQVGEDDQRNITVNTEESGDDMYETSAVDHDASNDIIWKN